MTGRVLLLAGTALVAAAVWSAGGLAAAAAVVALAGWLRAEACHRGAASRLRAAALALEASEQARTALEARIEAMPLVQLTVATAEDAEEIGRTVH